MDENQHRADLTIYHLRKTISDAESAIRGVGSLKTQEIIVGKDSVGTLYITPAHASPPKWAKFFEGHVPPQQFGRNSLTGALLAVEVANRHFIVAFGKGRHSIDSEFIETSFGLRVAINCLDEKSLRSLDKASFEAHPRQSREQTGKDSALPAFGLDIERDLLRALTGRPTDSGLGARLSGMDAVKVSLSIDLSGLHELLGRLLKEYRSEAYKTKGFSFVDHLGEVKNPSLTEKLDEQLIDHLNSSSHDRIWLAVPDLIDWDRAVGFKYSLGLKAPRVYDVRVPDFLDTLDGAVLDKALLMRRKIYCVDVEDDPVIERPAYYYIYAEIEYKGKTYLLNNGRWYLVQSDYVDEINTSFKSIPKYAKALPSFQLADESEEGFNKRVATQNAAEFALLDRKLIYVPGAVSPVEACDLFRQGKELIHVKRYGGSSLFSHLFNQGLVSGELLRSDSRFRKLMNGHLPSGHKLPNPDLDPKPGDYKVIYAVISEHDEDLTLPFFSRISLRHAANRLRALGFAVELAKISVADDARKTKVCRPDPKLRKTRSKPALRLRSA
jgi:uncharacterized protein (TIGR04141 family)